MIIQKTYNVGIYVRLSKDDERSGESVSIENQKLLLTKYVAEQPAWSLYTTYADDGWSGSNFERPAFKEMMDDVHNGVINLILVKDLSRLGRNYIEVGRYTDFILPAIGCRFVALSDGIDTRCDDNDMMHFRSLLNDYYLKDLSKKIKTSHRIMAQEGKRVAGRPPYGYQADSTDRHKYIVDEYAAGVVKRIYEMRLQNMSYGKIAGTLNTEGILSPREYEYYSQGKEYPYKQRSVWLTKSVKTILHSECYLGHRVQLKQGTLSYRLPKIVQKPQENWARVENVHPAIIGFDIWNSVQVINEKARPKKNSMPKRSSLFRGMLRCADCESAFTASYGSHKWKDGTVTNYAGYQCLRYAQTSSASCSSHRIKESTLKQILVDDIQKHACRITIDRDKVISALQAKLNPGSSSKQSGATKKLQQVKAAIYALEQKIAKLYEDKVSGIISEQSFALLIRDYESERNAAKTEQLRLLEEEVKSESKTGDIMNWVELIDMHRNLKNLDRDFLDEVIDKIEVGKVESVDGVMRQNIKIYYKMVGTIE